ncbi:MAG: sulfite exporter TauE/SafE family protein [Dehalococcoidales bacterium]|nr:sulfite exporter TauE/SafE family protein [Dehalococcoidales bacterium]
MPAVLIILLGTGLAIGFVSGLLGIGGGILMTPIQYWLYTFQGINTDLAVKMSFATSLAVILPTAASGVWRHHRLGNLNWRVAVFMGIFTAIGSFAGAGIASRLPGASLRIGFGIMALLIVIRMLTVKVSDTERPIRENRWLWFILALPIGIITGIMGIGGGVIVVPALVLVLRFRIRSAAATSLGMMLFTSVGGIIGYILNGIQQTGLPAYTIGYIYWPAWIALAVTSIFMVQVGAVTAHRLTEKQLNYIFVSLLFLISLDMLGVFEWIISSIQAIT